MTKYDDFADIMININWTDPIEKRRVIEKLEKQIKEEQKGLEYILTEEVERHARIIKENYETRIYFLIKLKQVIKELPVVCICQVWLITKPGSVFS